MFIDSHCHIHDSNYDFDIDQVIDRAHTAGVGQMICVGTDAKSSIEAVNLASIKDGLFSTIGLHPHYADQGTDGIEKVFSDNSSNRFLVAIGEIGLDYFYKNSPRHDQILALETQLHLALEQNLPIVFHVRDAFDDFWPILDNFSGKLIRGVLHSFTDNQKNADEGMKRGLYLGVNGISTFTKDESQKIMFANLPLGKMLLETDAPYLTPAPVRGKVKLNEPAFIKEIAQHHANLRQIDIKEVASVTTANVRDLFGLVK